ncbi:hypothetical protein [Nocardia coubleae]|uniref:Uncharacterized protein n=1 Tax=Nocardia coubleae TaxID=356147 RepID=A0A846VZ36_9NOCA|nr:hypothetical protein [Nocardia coubleae]NKX86101.1 hypothetical protein [Nocardia coubleae]
MTSNRRTETEIRRLQAESDFPSSVAANMVTKLYQFRSGACASQIHRSDKKRRDFRQATR